MKAQAAARDKNNLGASPQILASSTNPQSLDNLQYSEENLAKMTEVVFTKLTQI